MTLNPGSPEAREQGCICPQDDNNHGRGYMWTHVDGEDVPFFVEFGDCPLHGAAVPTSAKRCPACNGRMGIIGEQAFCGSCPNIEEQPEFLRPAAEAKQEGSIDEA